MISVGNLAVGGRGKTPLVACLARLLLAAGEQPAILSRGYGRLRSVDGVVVVSASDGLRADLARSGDEPLMLARQLPGVSVLVSSDRYLAGRLAEHHLGATVHLLDDGFQHLQLERDVDLVIVAASDLAARAPTLPFGHLRERGAALRAADALVSLAEGVDVPVGMNLPLFVFRRAIGAPCVVNAAAVSDTLTRSTPLLAVAGIADPHRFTADLRHDGWNVVGVMRFRDHHPFSARDVSRMWDAAQRHHAAVITTEKDLMRLLPFRPFQAPVAVVPLTIEPEPMPDFPHWLGARLAAARDTLGG